MNKHEIYLGGGAFWGTQDFLAELPGVLETEAGLANTDNDTNVETFFLVYPDSMAMGTTECVKVVYDTDIIPTTLLLKAFFGTVDPYSLSKQIDYSSGQPEAAIFWTDPEDSKVTSEALAMLQHHFDEPITITTQPLKDFKPAGTYVEDYIARNLAQVDFVGPDEAARFVDDHHGEFGPF